MALIFCPECKKEVSDQATLCPYCAYPIEAVLLRARNRKWLILKWVSILVIVISIFFAAKFSIQKETSSVALRNIALGFVAAGFLGLIAARAGVWFNSLRRTPH